MQFEHKLQTISINITDFVIGQTRQTESFLSVVRSLGASLRGSDQGPPVSDVNDSTGNGLFEYAEQYRPRRVLPENIRNEDHNGYMRQTTGDVDETSSTRSEQSEPAPANDDYNYYLRSKDHGVGSRTRDNLKKTLWVFNE